MKNTALNDQAKTEKQTAILLDSVEATEFYTKNKKQLDSIAELAIEVNAKNNELRKSIRNFIHSKRIKFDMRDVLLASLMLPIGRTLGESDQAKDQAKAIKAKIQGLILACFAERDKAVESAIKEKKDQKKYERNISNAENTLQSDAIIGDAIKKIGGSDDSKLQPIAERVLKSVGSVDSLPLLQAINNTIRTPEQWSGLLTIALDTNKDSLLEALARFVSENHINVTSIKSEKVA